MGGKITIVNEDVVSFNELCGDRATFDELDIISADETLYRVISKDVNSALQELVGYSEYMRVNRMYFVKDENQSYDFYLTARVGYKDEVRGYKGIIRVFTNEDYVSRYSTVIYGISETDVSNVHLIADVDTVAYNMERRG